MSSFERLQIGKDLADPLKVLTLNILKLLLNFMQENNVVGGRALRLHSDNYFLDGQ